MLITPEQQKKFEKTAEGLAVSLAYLAMSEDVPGREKRKLSFLEQAYVTGKIASELGMDRVMKMSEEDIQSWVNQQGFNLSPADVAIIVNLRGELSNWVENQSNRWIAKIRTEINVANRSWTRTLEGKSFKDSAEKLELRSKALEELTSNLEEIFDGSSADADTLIQTQLSDFFQEGQVTGVDPEEYVYKVPRLTACKYCLDLHLNSDGTPKVYKLKEVLGQSNVGSRAYEWGFTIGPTHPHCYCILYRVTEKAPEPSTELADARRESRKSRKA